MGAIPLKTVTSCYFRGEEGVETPIPNNSSKDSLSPPVEVTSILSGETGKQTNVHQTC